MEQNKAKGRAKITIEIEGQETEVIETDLFTLIADLGEQTSVNTFFNDVDVFRVAHHIRYTESNLEKIKRKAPEAVALLALVEAEKQKNEAKTNKGDKGNGKRNFNA